MILLKEDSAEMESASTVSSRVTSTAKALRILDCFSPARTELTLAQISRLLSMPKSTLLNQIRTLEEAGYLLRIRDGQAYRLGYKVMQLSYCAQAGSPVAQYAIPVMEDLQSATGDIIYLTSHIDGKVFYMECVYPSRRSISYSVSGKTLPMHCTGCGKAMLSQMPTEQVEAIIRKHGLPPITQNTITDHDQLMEALATYRRKGYALDNEEETMGVKCVAMPSAPDVETWRVPSVFRPRHLYHTRSSRSILRPTGQGLQHTDPVRPPISRPFSWPPTEWPDVVWSICTFEF